MATPTIPTDLLEPIPLDKPPAIMTEYELGHREGLIRERLTAVGAAKAYLSAEGGSAADVKWLADEQRGLLDELEYVRTIGLTPYADRIAEHRSMFPGSEIEPEAVSTPEAPFPVVEASDFNLAPAEVGLSTYSIKPFEGPGYEENVQNSPGGTTPCAICGKPVPAPWPHKAAVIEGGDAWGHENSDRNDPGYMGVWPVDDECHMKYDRGVGASAAAEKDEILKELVGELPPVVVSEPVGEVVVTPAVEFGAPARRDVTAVLRSEKPLELMTATELSKRYRDLADERDRLSDAIHETRMEDELNQLNFEHDAVRAQLNDVARLRAIPLNVRRAQYEKDTAAAERLKRGEPGTSTAEVVRFSKRPQAEKKSKRAKLSPEERSAKAKIGGAARMAALSEKQRSELGRKGLMAACGVSPATASAAPSEPDYTPPNAEIRWTPEESQRLKVAGYMELAPAVGPGFRCGSCKFARARESGAPFASVSCSNPAVNTVVSGTHGCCNHFQPDAELGAPVVGGAWQEPICDLGYRGAPCGELVTPQGKEKSCYSVVPISTLITSHNPETWQKNPAYPANTQERDYTSDKEDQAKVGRIAKNPDPALLLSNNPTAVDGPPIVTGSGIVLGGNGRTMGLRLAYSLGTAGQYVDELATRAPMFGLTAEMVRSVEQPVLVRLVQGLDAATAADLADASSRYNEGLTGSLDEKARGVSDSRRLSPATLTTLAEGIERHESLRKAMAEEGRTIVAALRNDGIITPQNSASMVNPGGGLTELGKQRLEGAFLGLAAGSPDRLAQASPTVVQKLERLVPFLAAVKAVNPAADAIPTFQAAMDLIYQAESAKMTIDEFLQQGGLFDAPVAAPARPTSPTEAVMASIEQPAYEPFSPEAPVTLPEPAAEARKEAPPAEFDPEAAIKLIADDAESIRAVDLERLFDENRAAGRWPALAAWVKNARPDLATDVDRAMGIIETEDRDRPAKFTYLGAKEAAERIRNGLKSRSKVAWSVKINPADGWIVIAAPPKRMVKGAMTEDDRRELAKLMGSGAHIHSQGLTLAPTGGFFEEYVDRANGREPGTRGVSTNED